MEYRHRSSLIEDKYSPTHSIPLDFWERCLALYEERRSHMFGLVKKMNMKNVLIVEYAVRKEPQKITLPFLYGGSN